MVEMITRGNVSTERRMLIATALQVVVGDPAGDGNVAPENRPMVLHEMTPAVPAVRVPGACRMLQCRRYLTPGAAYRSLPIVSPPSCRLVSRSTMLT